MGTRIAVIVGVLLTMVVVVINSPSLRDVFVTSRPVADTSLPTAQSMQGLRAATRLLDRERRLRQQDRDRIAARESSSRLAITAPAFAATLTWNDMEPIGVFLERLPDGVSRPGESHPRALAELYVNVSAHTAPIIQPPASTPADASGRTAGARDEQGHRASDWLDGDVAVASCISAWPIEPTDH